MLPEMLLGWSATFCMIFITFGNSTLIAARVQQCIINGNQIYDEIVIWWISFYVTFMVFDWKED